MRRAFATFSKRVLSASRHAIPALKLSQRVVSAPLFRKTSYGLSLLSCASAIGFTYRSSLEANDEEKIQIDVGSVNDLGDGEMIEVDTHVGEGDTKILLIRNGDKIVALGNRCPHANAPLVQGIATGHRVICPWHNAAFCQNTGRVIAAPSLDGIPKYPVEIKDGRILVTIPKEGPVKKSAERPFVRHDLAKDKRTFVIVGGGAAGLTAAETLRQTGFQGRVIVVTKEPHLPYDRTVLSKNIGVPVEKITLRNQQFWEERDVEFMLSKEVIAVDAAAHEVRFRDGSCLHYDSVLVASGSRPRFPNIPGANFKNIFVLRSPEDSAAIKEIAGPGKKVVVIGSSFIGMETATALKKSSGVESVTVVGMESVPFERTLGSVVGGAIMKSVSDTLGVSFNLQRSAVRFEGKGDKVSAVVLDNGEKIPCDLVIVGSGVVPETEFVAGVRKGFDGSILADSFLRAAKDLYVAGDIVSFPFWLTGHTVRFEHWNVAQQQGRIAARNMAGTPSTYSGVPYFWCTMGGIKVNYVGSGHGYDDVVYEGDVSSLKFVAYYLYRDRVVAAASMGIPKAAPILSEAMRTGHMPTGAELRSGEATLATISRETQNISPCAVAGCTRAN